MNWLITYALSQHDTIIEGLNAAVSLAKGAGPRELERLTREIMASTLIDSIESMRRAFATDEVGVDMLSHGLIAAQSQNQLAREWSHRSARALRRALQLDPVRLLGALDGDGETRVRVDL